MKIYSTLQIGYFHKNNCEDFLIIEPIANDVQLVAVLDGCTMAKESVFAAILYGKILRKIAKQKFYEDFLSSKKTSLQTTLQQIIESLFKELRLAKNQLDLDVYELLCTTIIGVINTNTNTAEIIIIGDGVIAVNNNFTIYEQNDKPDYLGYHLSENFDNWFKNQHQKISIKHFNNLAICTDGILSFKNLANPKEKIEDKILLNFLLVDDKGKEYETFLDKKVTFITQNWKNQLTDDLAIIRILT